jgi:uncharacterized protein YdeI (YjbR/CyaY-like superfamily)
MDEGLHFDDLQAWRSWLATNHANDEPVWIRFYKKPAHRSGISYTDAVEEALCWGWIDSLIKRMDDSVYVRKFSRRRPGSNWSAANRKRVKKLLTEGRMQQPGRALIDGVDLDADPPNPATVAPAEPPPVFAEALAGNERARKEFERLPPSHKKRYVGWILSAKREETRRRRSAEAVQLLAAGKRLEMK